MPGVGRGRPAVPSSELQRVQANWRRPHVTPACPSPVQAACRPCGAHPRFSLACASCWPGCGARTSAQRHVMLAPLLPASGCLPHLWRARPPCSQSATASHAAPAVGWAVRRGLVEMARANATSASQHPAAWLKDLTAGGPEEASTVVKFGLNMDRSPSRTFTGRAWVQFEQALSAAFPGVWRARLPPSHSAAPLGARC